MEGRTTTGLERLLARSLEDAHEKVQAAHSALYDVQLSLERAENDLLAATGNSRVVLGMEDAPHAADDYARMRTEISELRPLMVPIVRWVQATRRETARG
jgi:hypothetical protein